MGIYKYKAFSLIELMVVVAIIGLISAIAVPSYKAYIVKAKTAEKVVLAFNLLDGLIAQHQAKGTFPATIDFAGTTVAAGSHWQVINTNSQGLIGLNYNTSGNNVSLQLSFSGLDGIPGYAPVAGNPNGAGFSSFVVGALDNGTTVRKVCGQAPYINQDIPLEYLPQSCNCSSVDNFLSTGTGC